MARTGELPQHNTRAHCRAGRRARRKAARTQHRAGLDTRLDLIQLERAAVFVAVTPSRGVHNTRYWRRRRCWRYSRACSRNVAIIPGPPAWTVDAEQRFLSSEESTKSGITSSGVDTPAWAESQVAGLVWWVAAINSPPRPPLTHALPNAASSYPLYDQISTDNAPIISITYL
ncbi:hypothetical protein ACJJTC_000167 [Scirpophaga incertulas]